MFDIVSFVRERILRMPKLVAPLAGEELSEKQTTKLGYFLLYCMFGAIIASAQWTLSIIRDIPDMPTSVPGCVTDMLGTFEVKNDNGYINYYGGYYGNDPMNCILGATHPQFDLTAEYNALLDPYSKIKEYKTSLQTLESQKRTAEYNQTRSQQDYNTSLTEKIAEEQNGIYNSQNIKQNIQDTRLTIGKTDAQISELNSQIRKLIAEHSAETRALRLKVDTANTDYKNAYLLYRIYVGILSFVFAFIVFFVLYNAYVRQKMKNSPHTIIFSVATFAYGLVLLQISGMFIWDLLPHRLLQFIENLFVIFTPLVYLVQFLWPLIIIAVFGYLVFRIQKRLYSPQNILKRFITDKKCPGCGNAVDFTKPFCPLCAHEIQIHCPHCHELTLKGMPHCSNCGTNLPNKDILSHSNASVFDTSLSDELKKIDTSGYTGVAFLPKGGTKFTSNRENIVKISAYMMEKLGKSTFEANEIAPYLDKILGHIQG